MTKTQRTAPSRDKWKSSEQQWLEVRSVRRCKQRLYSGNQEAAMQHTPRFLKIVNDAKSRVKETTVDEVKQKLDREITFCW